MHYRTMRMRVYVTVKKRTKFQYLEFELYFLNLELSEVVGFGSCFHFPTIYIIYISPFIFYKLAKCSL